MFNSRGVKDSEVVKDLSNSPLINVNSALPLPDIKVTIDDRKALKELCLRIALKDIDISKSEDREYGIKLVQKLFDDLENANYYYW